MNHIVQVLSNEYKTICLDKPLQESKRNFSSFLAHRVLTTTTIVIIIINGDYNISLLLGIYNGSY